MLRTTALRPFPRGILRFGTAGHPEAPGVSYVALWRLPRPDFHRLADCVLQGTPRILKLLGCARARATQNAMFSGGLAAICL